MSSSTSSSDPGAEATASDARPPLVAVVMLGASVFLAVAAADTCRRLLMPQDLQRISAGDRASVRTIVIGDSTENAAVSSARIGPDCVNLAISGSGFTVWEPILCSAVRQLPELQTVVMSSDPMSLLRDGLGPRHQDYSDLYARGVMPSDISGMTEERRSRDDLYYRSPLRVLCSGPRLNWTGLCDLLRRHELLPRQKLPFDRSQGAEKKQMYDLFFGSRQEADSNLAALGRMLETIQTHQLNLVLFRTPVTTSFYETNQTEWESWHDRIIAETSRFLGTNGFRVVNLQQPDGFSLNEFQDPNHLNQQGRDRFSDLLRDRLQSTD